MTTPAIPPEPHQTPESAPKPPARRGYTSKRPTDAPRAAQAVSAVVQPSLFEAPADPVRDLGARLSVDETTYRARILQAAGQVTRDMRAWEASPVSDDWCAEGWRWVTSLAIVQGHNPKTTIHSYINTLRRFATWLLATPPEAGADYRTIGANGIEAWTKALMIQHRHSVAWRKVQISAIKSFYDWRCRAGLGLNCAEAVRSPKRTQRVPRKYTVGQTKALFKAVRDHGSEMTRDRDRILLLFFLTTGARRDEAATLRIDQVDLGEKTGTVRFFGKGAKERTVGIEGPIVTELRNWILLRDQIPQLGDTVFWSTHPSSWGMPLTGWAIEDVVRRHAKVAGLGTWGVHRFRTTYATKLYDDGVDIERIRIALGHQNIETTRGYLAVSERQASTRMRSALQYQALGEDPPNMPRWLKAKQERAKAKGNPDAPF